jgi:hypothetical protein
MDKQIEALREGHETYIANYGKWEDRELADHFRDLSERYLRLVEAQ